MRRGERPDDDEWPREQSENERKRDPLAPDTSAQSTDADGQAKGDKDDEIGKRGERTVEALDLAFVGHARVTH